MGRFFVTNSRNSYIRGFLMIILGGFLLFVPGLTMRTVMIIIGIMILVSGLVTMILSNWNRPKANSGFWSTQGIFNVLFGIVFINSPSVMVKIFVVFLGVILLFLGVLQMIGTLGMLSRSAWGWILFLIALVTLASGVFLLSDPFKSAETLLPFLGAILTLNGVSGLFMAWKAGHQPQTHKGAAVEDIPYEEV